MSRLYVSLILFFIFILEGVAIDLLPTKLFLSKFVFVPHWVLVALLLQAFFFERKGNYYTVIYAAIAGLLIDIVYIEILGIHMFTYAVIIYLILELKEIVQENIVAIIVLGILAIGLADIFIYFVYLIIGVGTVSWSYYFIYRIAPTVIANLVFLLILYPFAAYFFANWRDRLFERA